MLRAAAVVGVGCALLGATQARADIWDQGSHDDNMSATTRNELLHGLQQVHDLAAREGGTVADVDWYRLQVPFNTSFEVVLDGVSGGIANGSGAPALQLVDPPWVGDSIPVTDFGSARRLQGSYAAPGSVGEFVRYVRVQGAACGVTCTSADQYRIRFYDTTLRLSRFNNTGGQVSVLIVQNPTRYQVSVNGYAFGAAGQALGGFLSFLEPYEVQTLNLAAVSGGALANKSGGIQLLNSAGYGELAGKAVVMDPATGFVFESPLTYRPY
jgi:hypothetical protein